MRQWDWPMTEREWTQLFGHLAALRHGIRSEVETTDAEATALEAHMHEVRRILGTIRRRRQDAPTPIPPYEDEEDAP